MLFTMEEHTFSVPLLCRGFHTASLALVICGLNYALFTPSLEPSVIVFLCSIKVAVKMGFPIRDRIESCTAITCIYIHGFGLRRMVFPIMTESIDRAGLVAYAAGFGSVVGAGRSLSLLPAVIASRGNHFGLRLAATSALAMIGANTITTAGRLGCYSSVVPVVTESINSTGFSRSATGTHSLFLTAGLAGGSNRLRPAAPAMSKSRNRFRVARTAGTSIGFSSAGSTSGALCNGSSIAMSMRGLRGLRFRGWSGGALCRRCRSLRGRLRSLCCFCPLGRFRLRHRPGCAWRFCPLLWRCLLCAGLCCDCGDGNALCCTLRSGSSSPGSGRVFCVPATGKPQKHHRCKQTQQDLGFRISFHVSMFSRA